MNDMNNFLTCIQFTLNVLHCKFPFHVNISIPFHSPFFIWPMSTKDEINQAFDVPLTKILYLKEISFEPTNMPQYPQDFPLPTLPNLRNKTFKDGTETRAKAAEHVNTSLDPEALHQQLNIIEIAVVLVIGATTAIGWFLKTFYGW